LWQLNSGTPRLRQPYRDRLFGGTSAVLALSDMLNFLANEIARLSRRSLSLFRVALCSL